jgi:sec-independent protein translocase protein TatA
MNLASPVHLLFLAAIALIFIGPKRLPELARALGSGMRGFRDLLNGDFAKADGTPAERLDDADARLEAVAPAPASPFP